MKIIKTLVLVSALTIGITQSVFASWWNPFTWFQKKAVQVQQVQQNSVSSVPIVQNIQVKTVSSTTEVVAIPKDSKFQTSGDWKTYKNVECNFSVKYPENWKIVFNDYFKTCDKFIFWLDSPTITNLEGFSGIPMKYGVHFTHSSSGTSTIISEFVGMQVNQLALPVTYNKTTYSEYKIGQQIIKSFKDSLVNGENSKVEYIDRY